MIKSVKCVESMRKCSVYFESMKECGNMTKASESGLKVEKI